MNRCLVVVALCAAGCASAPVVEKELDPELEAARSIEAALAKLPACPVGVDARPLTLAAAMCTKKRCADRACCNACTWSAGQGDATLDVPRVREALSLKDSALECEIAVWANAVKPSLLSFGETPCVVRHP